MIKTIIIATAAAASLGASTQTAIHQPAPPSAKLQYEIIAGPLHWTRKDGPTEFSIEPNFETIFSIKIGERKAVKIHL